MKRFYLIAQIFMSTVCFSSPLPEIISIRSFDGLIDNDEFDDISNNSCELPPIFYQDEPLPFCESSTDPIIYSENDIIIGKSVKTNGHPGNTNFMNRIKANRRIYQSLDKQSKAKIVKGILNILKEEKIRFLEFNEIGKSWCEVSDEHSEKVIEQSLNEESS